MVTSETICWKCKKPIIVIGKNKDYAYNKKGFSVHKSCLEFKKLLEFEK